MTLAVLRSPAFEESILGKLSIDGVFFCFTLEGVTTAIPAGRYRVAITFSNRFQRDLPEVLDVPGRLGIRIHPGNTQHDTSGCILVGKERGTGAIWQSKEACAELLERLQSSKDGIAITVENPAPEKAA